MADADFNSTSPPYGAIADEVTAGVLKHISLDAVADTGAASLGKFFTALLKFATENAEKLAELGGRALVEAEEPILPIFAAFVAPIVANMFGTPADAGLFHSTRNRDGRGGAARAIVDAYMAAMTPDAGGELTPSDAGAKKLAGAGVHAALEGWFNGIVPEMLGEIIPIDWLHFHDMTELSEAIIRSLGIGRLVRRGLSPLVDVTAATPMKWKVNKVFTPALLSESMAVREFLRGKWTRAQLDEELARQGWSAARIEAHLNSQQHFFGPSDVRQFVERGFWSNDQGLQHLRDQGYDETAAVAALRLGGLARLEQLEGQEASAAIGAYAAGDIDRSTFDAIIGRSITPEAEQHLFTELAEVRRAVSVKHLAHGEVRDCVKRGILTTAFYRGWLVRENYQPDEAFALELLLRSEIDEKTAVDEHRRQQLEDRAAEQQARDAARKAKQDQVDAERALHRRGSIADLRRAVVRGLIPVDRLEEVLSAEYDPDTVGVLVSLVEDERAAAVAQAQRADEARQRAARRNLDLSAIEQAVLAHVLTIADYQTRLRAMGFDDADTAVLAATLQVKLEDQDAVKQAHDKAKQLAAARHIDLGRAEYLVVRGVYGIDAYDQLLQTLGFEDASRAALRQYIALRIAEYKVALEERSRPPKPPPPKGLTIDQARRAVILGAMTRDAFQTYLVTEKYTADAQIALLAELDDDVTQAAAARRRRAEAESRSGHPAIALSTLARAAQLGLIPVAAYEARLVAAGYSADDIAIERALLVQEIAAIQAARKKRDELAAAAADHGLSLEQLARAVKAGVQPIEAYRARAAALGYSVDDTATLAGVVEQELKTLTEARQRKAALAAAAPQRDPSVAQLEKAVKHDELSMDAYAARLTEYGYDPADVDLLVAVLADEISAAADKANNAG